MKKSGLRLTLLFLSLLIPSTASAQDDGPLDTLLPEGEGRELVADYCTRCHSSERIRQVVVQGQGGNEAFWRALVGRMVRVFNAPIASHDVDPIVSYLATHFGPSLEERPEPISSEPIPMTNSIPSCPTERVKP